MSNVRDITSGMTGAQIALRMLRARRPDARSIVRMLHLCEDNISRRVDVQASIECVYAIETYCEDTGLEDCASRVVAIYLSMQ